MKKQNPGKIIKTILIIFIVLFIGLFLLVMCSGDDEETDPEAPETGNQSSVEITDNTAGRQESAPAGSRPYGNPDTTWTVMLYLCGTDLESRDGSATANLEEIFDADPDGHVNIVVEAGGTKKWKTKGIPKGKLSRLHVENKKLVLDESCPSPSMGQADTLRDFISWGASNYPADRYMLVLWDHGGGSLFGVCNDELFNDDSLSLKELETALSGAGVQFELAGFDACLMSSLETAQALQNHAHYMVASEETEPGWGWDYTAWLDYLSHNKGCSGKDLGKVIVESYMDKCSYYEQDDMATLSVCDLTALKPLSAAFRNYSGELVLSTQNASDFQTVVQGASQTESYGERSGADGTFDMVDLADLMHNTSAVLGEKSDDVLKALRDVVVFEDHGRYRSKASGLSVFYPKYVDSEIYSAYEEITDNTAYLEYTSIMNDDWDEGAWESAWQEAYADYDSEEYDYDDYCPEGYFDENEEGGESLIDQILGIHPIQSGHEKLEFDQFLDRDNIFNLKITSGLDLVKDVRFSMLYDEDGENCVYLGCDTDLNADYEKGEFSDNFRGTWITIGGEYVCTDVIDRTDDYDLYIIPAIVNGGETFIRAVYEYDKESFRVLGTYDGADDATNLSGRDIRSLNPGDKVDFIFYTTNIMEDEDEDPEEFILGSIVWSDDTKMTDEDLGDGSFYYLFEIEDIFGNITYSDPVIMEIKNGEMYAYEM